jgi:IS1 family transposase
MNFKVLSVKKNKAGLWTAVNKRVPGILPRVVGYRSAETFKHLWKRVRGWECFFYVTDGYCVYDKFINDCYRVISKTYMTRVEGENTRRSTLFSQTSSTNYLLF